MRRRSLARQLLLGAIVGVIALAAVPVVYVAGRDGVDAIAEGDPQRAMLLGGVALVAAIIPVVVLALYVHWLQVTARPREPHEQHIPTRAEDILLGVGTAAVVVGAWPIGQYTYRESSAAFLDGQLTFGILHAVLGITYLVFAVFCVSRYWQWMR